MKVRQQLKRKFKKIIGRTLKTGELLTFRTREALVAALKDGALPVPSLLPHDWPRHQEGTGSREPSFFLRLPLCPLSTSTRAHVGLAVPPRPNGDQDLEGQHLPPQPWFSRLPDPVVSAHGGALRTC